MQQTSKPFEPHFHSGTAVENGMGESNSQSAIDDHDKLDVVELLLVLARRKKPILLFTAGVAILATIIVLLLPKTYTATSTILPPQQKQSALNSMLGQMGAIAGLSGGDLGLRNPDDVFVAMLTSRTIEDNLINRFDLRKIYRVTRYQDAQRKLKQNSEIIATKEGLISISVTDHDPKRAAEIANAYVQELYNVNQNMAITEASQRRLFYEQQIKAELQELSSAELALRQVQEKSGLLQPEAQGRTIIASIADLRAQVATHEVQLRTMRSYATENNPELKRAETELAGMEGQLAKLEHSNAASGNGNIAIPARQMPEAELEYLRRSREVKYHEALYEFLGKQLEAARIDEGQNAILVQVVDTAVAPERKSGPRRLLIVLVSTAAAFLIACFSVLLMEALRRKRQDPSQGPRLALLWQSLKLS
ncbi:MAG: Wzz/FepE/Etk N-terminal domain-containing protein [Candidatus Korobacteraceae bacterium]